MNTQDWSPLGWTGWISLQSKGLSRVFSNTTVEFKDTMPGILIRTSPILECFCLYVPFTPGNTNTSLGQSFWKASVRSVKINCFRTESSARWPEALTSSGVVELQSARPNTRFGFAEGRLYLDTHGPPLPLCSEFQRVILGQWFSKWVPQTSSITITWELARNANSCPPPPRPRWEPTLHVNKQSSHPEDSDACSGLETTNLRFHSH